MKTLSVLFPLVLIVALDLFVPVFLQSIQSRHYRPLPEKCDRHGRCSPKESDFEEDGYKSDKDIPPELGKDDRPLRPIRDDDEDYDRKAGADKDDGRPGGGYNLKPSGGRDDDRKPSGGGRPGGVGHDSGYNPKPSIDRDDGTKPARRPGGGGYEVGIQKPKPVVDMDEYNSKPSVDGGGYGGGRFGGDGYKPKPVVYTDDDDDPKLHISRPSTGGGGYGGGSYKPNPPVDRDDDPKPSISRPITGGGGYGGGGYKPKDEDSKPVIDRPSGGGDGYGGSLNPKPVADKDGYKINPGGTRGGGYNPRPYDEEYDSKPVRGGGGYYPGEDRKPNKEDLGGYSEPKDEDYNDEDLTIDDSGDDYDDASIPVGDNKCICVPYYQCKDGHIVTDGGGIIDARKSPVPDERPVEVSLDDKSKPSSCGPYHVCCSTPESSTVRPYEHRCGVRNPSGINSRILSPSNEGEADFGEWPWQAAVLKSEGQVNIFQCGGVLIDKYHVLTVAHCVFHLYQLKEYPLKVRLGEWDTQTTTEFLAHEDYKVSNIIIHPDFRNTSLWNDIAVLKLQDPVLFAPHIDTICLPAYDEVFSGQNCVVTGWGKDAYKGGTFSNVMKEVALQVIDNYQCEEMLRKTRLGRFFQLDEGFLCAGGEFGLDSCKGDGGGPLVCYRKDKSHALAGLVSWGIDCGQPGVPGVYVKIQKYLDFISKSTGIPLQEYWPKH